MAKILIGCRLPNGLTLNLPEHKGVTLAGLHSSKIIGATFVATEVDADFWAAWKTVYSDYKPLKSGAIFEARSVTEADSKGKELVKEKTGFEPMEPNSLGVKTVTKE
jgi:hypothetical protein